MNNLQRKYYNINRALYYEANNPLRSHGPDHHLRVLNNAMKLAEGKDVDLDVLSVSSLLHDISAYYPDEVGDNYHEEDPKRAEKILRDNDFPAERMSLVVDAIASHGSRKEYKSKRKSLESIILCDADKLDVFGPIGISRIIMVKTQRGGTLDDVVQDFLIEGHLQRKWDLMKQRRWERAILNIL